MLCGLADVGGRIEFEGAWRRHQPRRASQTHANGPGGDIEVRLQDEYRAMEMSRGSLALDPNHAKSLEALRQQRGALE